MLKKVSSLLAVALVAGCVEKDGSYEKSTARTADLIEKSSLDMNATYLYVPSTGAVPRYAVSQYPFFQGQEKLVQLQFTENGLEILELDKDAELNENGMIKRGRYVADNETGIENHPVLTIPGKHIDFRCDKDQHGECTNREEVVPENPANKDQWQAWNYFDPDYADIKQHEVNLTNLWFEGDNLIHQGTEVVSYEVKDGVINIELEKTFQADINSLNYYVEDLSSLSFKTRFYYSLVDINKLATADYQPVYYPETDHDTFGYFKTEILKNGVNGNCSHDCKRFYLMNRFNPDAESIDYHLSGNFLLDKNAAFLDATKEVVATLNAQMTPQGVPPIKLIEPTSVDSKRNSGDLRYNFINLVDDPLDNGLLGYGPSVAHPLTGEIVKAHVNQYSGVARMTARRVWNDLVTRYNRGDIATAATVNEAQAAAKTAKELLLEAVNTFNSNTQTNSVSVPDMQLSEVAPAQLEQVKEINRNPAADVNLTEVDNPLLKHFHQEQQRLHDWGEHTAFSEEAIWISSTVKGFIEGLSPDDKSLQDNNGELKYWGYLNDAAQQKVSDAIALAVYKSTLVHELGHNLGLRHNFQGSWDKDNFYSEAEAHDLGLKHIPAYSSVMDYAPSQLDELPVWGKYDLAAFRFAYNREVDLTPRASDSDADTLSLSLKGYDQLYAEEIQGADGENTLSGELKLPYGVLEHLDNYQSIQNNIEALVSADREKAFTDANNTAQTALTTIKAQITAGIDSNNSGYANQSQLDEAKTLLDAQTVLRDNAREALNVADAALTDAQTAATTAQAALTKAQAEQTAANTDGQNPAEIALANKQSALNAATTAKTNADTTKTNADIAVTNATTAVATATANQKTATDNHAAKLQEQTAAKKDFDQKQVTYNAAVASANAAAKKLNELEQPVTLATQERDAAKKAYDDYEATLPAEDDSANPRSEAQLAQLKTLADALASAETTLTSARALRTQHYTALSKTFVDANSDLVAAKKALSDSQSELAALNAQLNSLKGLLDVATTALTNAQSAKTGADKAATEAGEKQTTAIAALTAAQKAVDDATATLADDIAAAKTKANANVAAAQAELNDKQQFLTDNSAALNQAVSDATTAYRAIYSPSPFNRTATYNAAEFQYRTVLNKFNLGQRLLREAQTEADATQKSLNDFLSLKESLVRVRDDYQQLADKAGNQHIDVLADYRLKSYDFCTDGNVTLNTNCNRFDEGTSVSEILDYRIQSYEDDFRRLTTRDGRRQFYESNVHSYIYRRFRAQNEIRDVIEDFDRLNALYQQYIGLSLTDIDNTCRAQNLDFPICNDARAEVNNVEKAGNFLLDLAQMPDHLCELQATDVNGDVQQRIISLQRIYDALKFGQLPVGYPAPTSCFDTAIVEALANNNSTSRYVDLEEFTPLGDQSGTAGYVSATVLSEAGRYLNGFNNNDPIYKYSNERAVLGSWSDRTLALMQLMRRKSLRPTTDEGTSALVDIPSINSRYLNLVRHLTMGTALTEQLEFTDKEGEAVTLKADYRYNSTAEIEEPLFFNSPRFNRAMGIQDFGKTPLVTAMLLQNRFTNGTEGSGRTEWFRNHKKLLDYVSSRSYSEANNQLNAVTTSHEGQVYQATEDNVIAYSIITLANKKADMDRLAQTIDLNAVLQARRAAATFSDARFQTLAQVSWQAVDRAGNRAVLADIAKLAIYVPYYSAAVVQQASAAIIPQLGFTTDFSSWFANASEEAAFWAAMASLEQLDSSIDFADMGTTVIDPMFNDMLTQYNTLANLAESVPEADRPAYRVSISDLESYLDRSMIIELNQQLQVLDLLPQYTAANEN